MYIQPDTTVRVLQNCPLDNTYDHTIYFASKSAQSSYFSGLTKYVFNNLTYTRLNRGTIRVERPAEDLYNCNYLMYQNSSFGDKWFYAFITSVEYINNITTQINFEIDVMQTWFFDIELEQCFVEREHVSNDSIGANLQTEPIDIGEYTSNGYSTSGVLNDPVICINSNVNDEGKELTGGIAGGMFTGVGFQFADATETGAHKIVDVINQFDSYDELVETITSCFMYDRHFLDTDVLTATSPASYTVSKSKNYGDLDGYTPRNNKLYTYPYNYLLVTTDEGAQSTLMYEFFNGSSCQFRITGEVSANPAVICDPLNYKNCSMYRNERLTLGGFPQCTFNIDSFKAWLAQTASNPSVITGTIEGAAAGASGGAVGAVGGAIMSLLGTAIGGGMAMANPPEVKGTAQSSVSYAAKTKDFYFYPISVNYDTAKRIDDFFDVYGYAVNEHKVPNRNTRPHWNFVKNRVTNVVGNAPADDVRKIVDIYNTGITFWKNGNEVGNYSLDNTI